MSESVRNELLLLLEEATNDRRCAFASSRKESRRLERLCRKGYLVSPIRGLFYPAELWDALDRGERAIRIIRGLARKDPYLVFCGPSAALVWGMPISWDCLDQVHLGARGRHNNKAGSPVRWHTLPTAASDRIDGVRVTSLKQTTLCCLRMLDFADGLAIADHYLRITKHSTKYLLQQIQEHCSRRRGAQQAYITASFANPLAESGGESILRANIISLGFAIPKLQVKVTDPIDVGRHYRLDLLLVNSDGIPVDIELDGKAKYTDERITQGANPEEVRERERLRESRITARGIQVARFSFADAMNLPRLERILHAFGLNNAPGMRSTHPARRQRRPAAGRRWRKLRLRNDVESVTLRIKTWNRLPRRRPTRRKPRVIERPIKL